VVIGETCLLFAYSREFKPFLDTSRAILSAAALASIRLSKLVVCELKESIPGAVGAVLSASNRSGKGEVEESKVAAGVIMEIIRLVVGRV
jgi:hypothetical protein